MSFFSRTNKKLVRLFTSIKENWPADTYYVETGGGYYATKGYFVDPRVEEIWSLLERGGRLLEKKADPHTGEYIGLRHSEKVFLVLAGQAYHLDSFYGGPQSSDARFFWTFGDWEEFLPTLRSWMNGTLPCYWENEFPNISRKIYQILDGDMVRPMT